MKRTKLTAPPTHTCHMYTMESAPHRSTRCYCNNALMRFCATIQLNNKKNGEIKSNSNSSRIVGSNLTEVDGCINTAACRCLLTQHSSITWLHCRSVCTAAGNGSIGDFNEFAYPQLVNESVYAASCGNSGTIAV